MKVFISWSGERSEALAKALHNWFPLVLHYTEPWLSQSDIHAGERWGIEVAKNLEDCNFGIICITKENLNAPWILFEAGALAKSMQDGRVIPLLLDIEFKEISGPLAQFQAKKVECAGMKELVLSLNKVAATPIPDERLDKLFSISWNEFENQIKTIPNSSSSKHSRPQGEILEELVSGIRSLEMRFRDVIDDDSSLKKPKRTKFHPMLLIELSHRFCDGPSDPIQFLIAASLFRDDLPWIYELALEAYKAAKLGDAEESLRIQSKFAKSMEILMHTPMLEEMGFDRRMYRALRELMPMLDPHLKFGIKTSASEGTRRKIHPQDGVNN